MAREISSISRGPLKSELKRKLIVNLLVATVRGVITLSSRGAPRGVNLTIYNYKYRFFDFYTFRILFAEIFIKLDYYVVLPQRSPIILDCGSNVGASVAFFKMLYPSARITAFEPDPEAFSLLRENVSNNGLLDVRVLNLAVSSAEGELEFFYDTAQPGSLRMSSIMERVPTSTRTSRKVPAARLSAYITDQIDLLKLDVEGSELGVVQELASAGKLPLISRMAIEYHHHISGAKSSLAELCGLLESHGFDYQIQSSLGRPIPQGVFQDIMLYAYRGDAATQ